MAETITVNGQNSTGDTLEDRIKVWEKEKRGLIDDLRTERDKRHTLEKEVEEIRNALNSAAEQPEADPQSKVNRLAQDPDGYILGLVRPELEARDKEISSLKWEKKFDRAYQWLAKQEKKDVEDLYGSELETEIVRITKEHSMGMMDPVEGTRAAYKILQQERREKEEQEMKRDKTISNNATQTVRTPPSSGARSFTRQEIADMNLDEFTKNKEAISEAQRRGLIS